jgi:hypothetical protein
METMNQKQKEALVIAMRDNGKSYRDIVRELKMSPNTVKTILNRAGLEQSTSLSSRAFELFSEGRTLLDVAIKLNLEAEEAIRLHQQYFMLLGCTEFTRVYQEIKDDPWPFVKLVKVVQDEGISEDQVVQLLKIANNYLPRVTSQYEKLKANVNSLEFEKSNSARQYQQLCDRVFALNNRVDQLQLTVKESEDTKAKLEIQNRRLQDFVKNFQDNNIEYYKVKQAIRGEVENMLADRRRLLSLAVRSVIELLRLEPQKFLSLHYNRSTIQPENSEEPVLVEADRLYAKMLENITNQAVTKFE